MADQPYVAITIARQLGAGGAPLGKRLAKRLGFTYLDDEILRLAAEKAGADPEELARWDEHRARFWERLGGTFSMGAPEGLYTSLNAAAVIHDRDVFELQSQVIREHAARTDCVIIGRAGFWVLRDHPGRLSVYLHAPAECRVAQVAEMFRVDAAHARQLIAQIDADRARFVRETTGMEIAATSQHICLDTSLIRLETAEEIVATAIRDVRDRMPPCPEPPASVEADGKWGGAGGGAK
jgi:cytidylate kinase